MCKHLPYHQLHIYAAKLLQLGRMTGFIALWWVSVCSANAQNSLKGLPLIRTFSTEEYQGGIQNWDITQGANDLLYVANNFGLLIYDGEKWTTLPIEQATRILAVAYSSNGLIYVGGQGDFGYFQATKNGTLNYTSLKENLPANYRNFNEIWKIYTLGKVTYFFTLNHIFKLENDQLEVINPATPLGFSFKVRNRLFTQVPSQGLMALEGNLLKPIGNGEKMIGKDIRGIVPFDMNKTLVATRNQGLFLIDSEGAIPWEVSFNEWLKKAQINTIQLLSSNQYAIGTQNEGILIIDQTGNVVQLLSEERGLTNNSVLSLFEDRFGNLWAGLNNGIAIIELEQPFTFINDGLDLSGTGYTAFKTDSQVYLGTNNGLFILEKKSKSSLFYPRYKKVTGTEGQTYSLQMVAGNLILGHHQGAFIVEPTKAIDIENNVQGIWRVKEIPNAHNTLIAGSYTGMYLIEKKADTWRFQQKIEGFDESFRKFEIVDSTTIWMSHGYKGLYKLRFSNNFKNLEETRFYSKEAGFPSNLLINVFKIENRLVFAAEKGIYQYNPSTDRFVEDSLLSSYFGEQHIREIEEDILGNLYFITDDEIAMLKKNILGQYEKETKPFQKILPFLSDDLENITVVDSENILINAKEGFIHYNPNKTPSLTKTFSTIFRQISWGDSLLFGGHALITSQTVVPTSKKEHDLPFSKNSIRFNYSSVFFEGTYQAQYQFWLENFDSDWSKWSTHSEKEYTNLPSGEYTFRVRSRNSLGTLSNPEHFRFRILPPWYLSKFAFAVYTIVGVCALVLFVATVNRKYKEKQRNIVENAHKTIQEKETKLQEVTTQSEKEIAQLKSERLEAELQHKNQQLASSAMHLINKNELMNSLKLEIKHLLKEDSKQATDKGLKRLVKVIEKNIAEDETWSQFEMHFDQVHGDFIKKLRENYPSLTPQELKISAFLRMNMSSKKIAHLLNISVRGVEISRYRLRKKLPIESHQNLVEFMMEVS